MPKKLGLNSSTKTWKTLAELIQRRCSLHHRDGNAKVGSQEIPRVTGKFGLGVQIKQGKGQQSFAKRMHWSQQKPSFNNIRDDSTHGHHQMVNTKIRLILVFAAKDGEALYSQQKQDRELTVAQIMNSLLPNSDSLVTHWKIFKLGFLCLSPNPSINP